MNMKAIIIGKNGQLAYELQQTVPKSVEVEALGRNDIDLSSLGSVESALDKMNPSLLINASAYTAVDKAEEDVDAAFMINETGVRHLALAASARKIRLIHISTDFVFDGNKNTAYTTSDQTNPVSVYGASKLAGEKAIADICSEDSTVIRTSWAYSTHGNNFVKTMLRLMAEKEELGVVVDQIGCPTCANQLSRFIWKLSQEKRLDSIYHWTDLGVASWYDFAIAIQDIAYQLGKLKRKITINPIPSSAYPTPAKRPNLSLLDVTQSQNILRAKHWREQLEIMFNKL